MWFILVIDIKITSWDVKKQNKEKIYIFFLSWNINVIFTWITKYHPISRVYEQQSEIKFISLESI